MTKQPFRFALFLLMCLLVASTAAAQVEIAAVPSADNPAIGDTIEISINIAGASNVAGYQVTLTFNPTQLEFISIENSDYLPAGAFETAPTVENGSVGLTRAVLEGAAEGDGTLAIATFKVLVDTEMTVEFGNVLLISRGDSGGFKHTVVTFLTGTTINSTASGEDVIVSEDVVNILDPGLRAAVENVLGKAPGDPITMPNMAALAQFAAPNANITDLTGLESATNLTFLNLGGNNISNLSPLAGLTNLTWLTLSSNTISDISPLAGLTNLTRLTLSSNAISDISPLAGLTNLTFLSLSDIGISDISPLEGLTNLTWLTLSSNAISDISSVAGLTKLNDLRLQDNSISNISPISGLTNLGQLYLSNNAISDISSVTGLTKLNDLRLQDNSISDISPISGLTNLGQLYLRNNSISDILPISGLTNLRWLDLRNNLISDLSSLVENMGLGEADSVDVSENPLNSTSINTDLPALQSRGVEVLFENLKPTTLEYLLSIPAGISLIHVPLKVTEVDGVPTTIESISDLYDALGGADTVNFLMTYDSQTQEWRSYFVPSDRGGPADARLTEDKGIIANLITPVSVRLRGGALGTNGNSTITLNQGLNLVGLPLNNSSIKRVSDLLALSGINGNVFGIFVTDGREFKVVGRTGDPGDIEITGGQAFILIAQQAAIVEISGDAWTNVAGTSAAPQVALTGIAVGNTTPVLALRGSIVNEGTGVSKAGFRVEVKNLSTDRALSTLTKDEGTGYQLTVVDIETARAATIGDILKISAQSPNPFIGVQPLQYTVTAEDVRQSWIQLPALVAYEIPAETQLLANYPNPFNPETWIPYRLAEDAFVTLTIYDLSGQVVRTLNVGHQTAAVYESRSKAIYWDGRNNLGETVASGVYFYHLSADDFPATRKMLILK